MAKGKHLTLEDRIAIESSLKQRKTFKAISRELGKTPSTISREVRSRLSYVKSGALHKNFNACVHRYDCTKAHICEKCASQFKHEYCRNCIYCNKTCKDFEEYICPKLHKPPYVCNGCLSRNSCCLEKKIYKAAEANRDYRYILSELRTGTSLSEEEVIFLDEFITPLIRDNKQSPHHIVVTNADKMTVSERTIYRLIESQIISAKNIDLPRKVRYKSRKKPVQMKVDKGCRIGRSYRDFLSFMENNKDYPVVELDTVEGKKGGKVLLTIHFRKAEMMLAILRDRNDSHSVTGTFENLYSTLGEDIFKKIFKVCLADRGTEFSNPAAIEYDQRTLERRTFVFYCDPNAPYQKGSAERNHEFIRCFIPKGTDLNLYTQQDVSLMMDHINSYSRESLGNKSPYEMFEFLYGNEVLDLLGCNKIPPQNVTLSKAVFKR